MQHNDAKYIVGFVASVCLVCSLLVSGAASMLKPRQEMNALLAKQKKVLAISGLMQPKEKLSAEAVQDLFEARIEIRIVELESGEYAEEGLLDPETYDQLKALNDPEISRAADKNPAGVARVPLYATVYALINEEKTEDLMYVLPIEGKGLWSTLYGFLALDKDLVTIQGITFYQHGETPGLGAEIENPLWQAKWPGRKAFDENWEPAIRVIKGPAPSYEEAPHEVDGLSGATITSNGVTFLLQYWLGDEGFGPYLANLRAPRSDA